MGNPLRRTLLPRPLRCKTPRLGREAKVQFKPERFINHPLSAAASAAHPDPLMRDHLTYGGGRRICAGIHVAERSLFLVLSRLLWGFDLGLAKDAQGNDIPVDATLKGVMPGATSVAKPFKCSIKVRSKKREMVLRKEWADAQRDGIQFEEINFAKLVESKGGI